MPEWLAILVGFCDLLIVRAFVALVMLGHVVTIKPLFVSKLNTVMQILLIEFTLLQGGFDAGADAPTIVLIWCIAVTTVASGAAYIWNTASRA